MKPILSTRGFTLVELLAVIAIMAVLVVAAMPYVSDYTVWAQATAQQRDAQVISGAISRWIAVGGSTGSSGNSPYAWTAPCSDKINYPGAWTHGCQPAQIIQSLAKGWTVIPFSGNRDPFISPNTSFTQLGRRIKIAFTNARDWTVTGRSTAGFGY